jgi:hypothetical protein
MPWEVKCECGWVKEYRNPVAARWGGESHTPHCPFYRKALEMIDFAGATEIIDKLKEKRKMAKKVFDGKTEDAGAPILSAGFWTKDMMIKGTVFRVFQTENGECYALELIAPITVHGANLYPKAEGEVKSDRFSIGGLKGFQMAVDASGAGKILRGDVLTVKATGQTDTGKGNPQINFKIRVERGDENQQEANF